MAGTFDLSTPRDLLAKLERELSRVQAAPADVDHAFNFVVTAEHMLDWLHPGLANESARRKAREADPLLQVVSHIANGAKHFDQLGAHHKSVRGFLKGIWPANFWAPGFWAKDFWNEDLGIVLDGPAAAVLGNRVSVKDLTTEVYEYWSTPGRVP